MCRKEVAFEEGKVLLSRLGDRIHATSAFCTHYGAPLVKGVLTSDARVVWYVPINMLLYASLLDPWRALKPVAWRFVHRIFRSNIR